nr:class I SAM-dependent methyltransferase [uncultured Carboxylicivirga sp.]
MEFYSNIVDAYDQLFPFNEKQLLFVEKALNGQLAQKSILDMGCGTGSLAIALARRSAKVRAFDYDEKMIEKAEEKRPQALDLQFRQGDMSTALGDYSSILFDAIICVGNTLVHLEEQADVLKLFWNIKKQLKPGGKFIFQIINYDRILKDQVDHLPTIENGDYTFARNYSLRRDGKINFTTSLSYKGNAVSDNEVILLPLQKSWLEQPLKDLFASVEFYGGFDSSEWTEESFYTIVEVTL